MGITNAAMADTKIAVVDVQAVVSKSAQVQVLKKEQQTKIPESLSGLGSSCHTLLSDSLIDKNSASTMNFYSNWSYKGSSNHGQRGFGNLRAICIEDE